MNIFGVILLSILGIIFLGGGVVWALLTLMASEYYTNNKLSEYTLSLVLVAIGCACILATGFSPVALLRIFMFGSGALVAGFFGYCSYGNWKNVITYDAKTWRPTAYQSASMISRFKLKLKAVEYPRFALGVAPVICVIGCVLIWFGAQGF